MRKTWEEPKLELLDIRETMGSWIGDSWDGKILGRKFKPGDPKPEEPPTGS